MDRFDLAARLGSRALAGGIDEDDIDTIIEWPLDELSLLFAAADHVRRARFGTSVSPCSIMNIKSGGCSEDCAFCSQSAHNSSTVEITGLVEPEAISRRLAAANSNGLPFCVVSSGRGMTQDEIAVVCNALKGREGEKHASLGILDDECFAMLADAGVVCYNHNLETSRSFFPRIVSTHTWDERVETIRRAKAAGIRVCSGGIFGVGESWEHRKEFALQLRELDIDIVPINFFNPIDGTRAAPPKETPLEFLKIVSLLRLVMADRTIKVCGGREKHLGSLQGLIFLAGANGYISGGYLTSGGAGLDADDILINNLGLSRTKSGKAC